MDSISRKLYLSPHHIRKQPLLEEEEERQEVTARSLPKSLPSTNPSLGLFTNSKVELNQRISDHKPFGFSSCYKSHSFRSSVFLFSTRFVFFFLPASVQVSVTPPAPPPRPVPPPAELFQRFKMSPFVFCGHQDSDAFCFQPLHFISPNKR